MDGLIGVLLCLTTLITPPAIVFAVHHRLKRPHNRVITKKRILVYCFLLFLFIGGTITAALMGDEVKYIGSGCWRSEQNNCDNILVVAQVEVWLQSVFYPVSQDVCFTGNDYACQYIDTYVGRPPYHDEWFARWVIYIIFAVIFAIPSVVLYLVLSEVYLPSEKQKRKNDG